MTRLGISAYLAAFCLLISQFLSAAEDAQQEIEFQPQFLGKTDGLRDEPLARNALNIEVRRDGLSKGGSSFILGKVQKSLSGTHYHYKQIINSIDVETAEIIVSISADGGSVFRVFKRAYKSDDVVKNAKAKMTSDAAFDKAWQHLRAHGELESAPTMKLVYYPINGKLHLSYVTGLSLSAPAGYWEHIIDAETGEVLKFADLRLQRNKKPSHQQVAFSGVVSDRKAAFAAFEEASAVGKRPPAAPATTRATGSGLVFDPDPRTTLNDNTLENDSPASAFNEAYFTRSLLDIAFDGTKYTLSGPWVKIADFELPRQAPSTSTTGRWTAKRGTPAFNDVMTYFHIDQSQRYIQSLGFRDETGIQFGPIEADSNGLAGDDNSHFLPTTNRLAFGHGCVDDNEDADVILHEYGHAIQHSINSNWKEGDTGAMGEGFGDYWAASYSLRTPNGSHFFPDEVYTWDGHGPEDSCWKGRILHATGARYVRGTKYDAHEEMTGGFQTDELWSTPLFQALQTLISNGVAHEEVDRIILEAHFGLGAGVTMPTMARAIVDTARRLYPNGPHAEVFTAKFQAQRIL